MRRISLASAEAEAAEARAWVCASCTTMIEPGHPGPHCRSCAAYWSDVGYFERLEEEALADLEAALSSEDQSLRDAGATAPCIALSATDEPEILNQPHPLTTPEVNHR